MQSFTHGESEAQNLFLTSIPSMLNVILYEVGNT